MFCQNLRCRVTTLLFPDEQHLFVHYVNLTLVMKSFDWSRAAHVTCNLGEIWFPQVNKFSYLPIKREINVYYSQANNPIFPHKGDNL